MIYIMSKVSIIIPAYNAAEFIHISISSIQSQNFSDYEIIIVNDGSTDHTAAIVEDLASKDNKIHLISIENSGPAVARNVGISHCTGDYIMFMDSDDTLLHDTLPGAVMKAEESRSDMVILGFSIINVGDQSKINYTAPEAVIAGREEIGQAIEQLYIANLLNQCWGKLYRRELIVDNNITFENYMYGEDRLFIFDCLKHTNGITVIEKPGYNYYMHKSESLITKFYGKKFDVCNEIDTRLRDLMKYFGTMSAEADRTYSYMYVKSVVSCMTNIFAPSCPYSFKEKYRYIKKIVQSEKVRHAVKKKHNRGIAGEGLRLIIKTRLVPFNLLAMWFVYKSSSLFPKLFIKLKHLK